MGATLTTSGLWWVWNWSVSLARLNYISRNSFPFMLLLKVGIKSPFAQDAVVSKEAAVLLCLCVEGRCWGTRTFMSLVASLSVHLVGTRQLLAYSCSTFPWCSCGFSDSWTRCVVSSIGRDPTSADRQNRRCWERLTQVLAGSHGLYVMLLSSSLSCGLQALASDKQATALQRQSNQNLQLCPIKYMYIFTQWYRESSVSTASLTEPWLIQNHYMELLTPPWFPEEGFLHFSSPQLCRPKPSEEPTWGPAAPVSDV